MEKNNHLQLYIAIIFSPFSFHLALSVSAGDKSLTAVHTAGWNKKKSKNLINSRVEILSKQTEREATLV